jgi:hypothetical protein
MMTKGISPRRRPRFFLRGKESDLDKGGARGRIGTEDTGFKGENLNIQRPKLNYSYLIHPTSESSM